MSVRRASNECQVVHLESIVFIDAIAKIEYADEAVQRCADHDVLLPRMKTDLQQGQNGSDQTGSITLTLQQKLFSCHCR